MITNHGRARSRALATLFAGALAAGPALGQEATATQGAPRLSEADLAKQLANPVAAMISVPFQLNYDEDIGPSERGDRWTLNIQPVIPIDLGADWNLVSRTILPVIWQDEIQPGAASQSGTGDTVQSFFVSPKEPTASGWIWGLGPVFLLPTGADEWLSGEKWGAGPTGVALKQVGPWTYGLLANHLWSFAGDRDRADISTTFLQPFMSYTTPTAWSFTLQTESTYDWENDQWSVPVHALASKVLKVGSQLVSVGGGVRYWAEGPDTGPHGWGVRFFVTLLFPR